VVELEAQPQQQAPLEDAAGYARVADGPEQDGVVLAQLVEHAVGQRLAGRVPASRAEVVRRLLDLDLGRVECRVEDLEALRDDLGPDAVARDDREPDAARHARHASRAVRQAGMPSRMSD
jgi:Arc/MetJ-type ribon-helix-helix transcriptional regulator